MMNLAICVDRMTDRDRALLTSYYRHWRIIEDNMECIGYRNGKPVFRPVEDNTNTEEVTDVPQA